MRTIRLATAGDLGDVLGLLNQAASWLHSRGLDQWPDGFGPERITPMIERGEVYIVRGNSGAALATVAVSTTGDTDFWTPEELAEPSLYVSKLATTRLPAGQGLGELLLRWTVDLAASQDAVWARLDVWRTNRQLHDWYRRAEWTHVRTVSLAHRRSGALFQRPAKVDLTARSAFVSV
ncbi:GNAT family N-acetyltransferase [Actinomadura sp. 6N118]|uniref:GNAT family N-acetyltransferase n=1 Tax=Actinomadura sp. 6N118 TaxID=3375151 RepID=UPI0037B20032